MLVFGFVVEESFGLVLDNAYDAADRMAEMELDLFGDDEFGGEDGPEELLLLELFDFVLATEKFDELGLKSVPHEQKSI